MPKRFINISGLDKGIYGNVSTRDVPDGFVAYSENIDGSIAGTVRSIRRSSLVSATFNPRIMIAKRFGTPEVIGQDAARQVKSLEIDSGTEANIDTPTTHFISSMVAQDKEIYCGSTTAFKGDTPAGQLWIGSINEGQFGQAFTPQRVVDSTGIQNYADLQVFADTVVANSPYLRIRVSGRLSNTVTFFTGDTEAFSDSVRYFWAFSFVYDGFQESALVKGYHYEGDDPALLDIFGNFVYFSAITGTATPRSTAHFSLRIAIETDGDFSRRITGVNVYRAEALATDTLAPETQYRFVTSIDINAAQSDGFFQGNDLPLIARLNENISNIDTFFDVANGDYIEIGDPIKINNEIMTVTDITYGNPSTVTVIRGSNPTAHTLNDVVKLGYEFWVGTDETNFPAGFAAGTDYYFARVKDDGSQGATYEDRTGRPDTLESIQVGYKLSTDYNSQLFAGVCSVTGVDDATQFIYRSSPQQYSVFNTAEDFLQLPEVPTALAGFGGRLYAFSETNTYRINPQGLFIEDTYAGVGALNEDMVIVTNFGMFHGDANNIYINNGTRSTPIGEPMLRVEAKPLKKYGWLEMAKTVAGSNIYARLAFDSELRRLLVFGASEADGSETVCWAYSLERQRWDLYTALPMPLALTNIPDGTVYFSFDNAGVTELWSLFSAATRHPWQLRTKAYSAGSDSIRSYWYELAGVGEGNFDLLYELDENGVLQDTGTSDDGVRRSASVAPLGKKARYLAATVRSVADTDSLDNLHIIYRPQNISS